MDDDYVKMENKRRAKERYDHFIRHRAKAAEKAAEALRRIHIRNFGKVDEGRIMSCLDIGRRKYVRSKKMEGADD